MNARLFACVLTIALLGAAPAPKFSPVPAGPQTRAIDAYLSALKAANYPAAYALLSARDRKYFRDAENFAGIFAADDLRLRAYKLVGTEGNDRGRLFFAHESLGFYNHLKNQRFRGDVDVVLGAIDEGGWHVRDLGHPWRAYAADVTQTADDLRVQVRKVSFYERRIEVVVNFANLGASFVNVLPYGKSVLKDDDGTVYRIIATKDPSLTDRELFRGLRLAPNAQYSGTLQFETPVLGRPPRGLHLTVSPFLRDGSDSPGELTFGSIPAAPVPR